MDIKPHIKEMGNGVLSREHAECFNNVPIKHEAKAENEAQLQNYTNTFSADEPKATVKIDNCTDSSVSHLVKTELVEFHNIVSNENSHQNLKDTVTVMSDKMMKTETKFVEIEVDPSHTCEEGDLYNNTDKKSDSNSDSDPERDPFADVHCDPVFSQTTQSHDSSAFATHSGSINSPKTENVGESSVLSSFSKSNFPTATPRILKHNFELTASYLTCGQSTTKCSSNFERETLPVYYTLQCHLCLVTQGSERELRVHLEICAASHKNRNRFCVLCNKLFSTSYWHRNHALKVHSQGLLQCQLCLKKLKSENQLKTHLEICAASHPNSRRFCIPCNKLLSNADTLKNHAFSIHGIVPVKRLK